jgi:hypothetical protein
VAIAGAAVTRNDAASRSSTLVGDGAEEWITMAGWKGYPASASRVSRNPTI